MITAGIDVGSLTTKAVVLDPESGPLGFAVMPTGGNNRETAEKVFEQAMAGTGGCRDDVERIISTGYGREHIQFAHRHVTEITCHAAGIHFLFPQARTIIDIGGQDTKGIQINGDGKVTDFVMNDKCAAGTGRFLEVMANALGVRLEELGTLSLESAESVRISSMCTVFAESEVVSLVARGAAISDIVRGLHDAIAERTVILLKRLKIMEPVAMSGGVAQNRGMVAALEEKLKTGIRLPPYPQIVGALGAAVMAGKEGRSRG